MKRLSRGFTLVELLVVIGIMTILASTLIVGMQQARTQSRDAQRQTDLKTVASALELYRHKYGEYPAGCNGATTGASPNWSGQVGSSYACSSGNQYIQGLTPEFLPELPRDPRLNPTQPDSGYVYTTNAERSVYKLMALNTVENETVTQTHEFFRCGSDFTLGFYNINNSTSNQDPAICARVPSSPSGNCSQSVPTPNECNTGSMYSTTYAVSAGFSTDARGNSSCPSRGEEYDTEVVRCK